MKNMGQILSSHNSRILRGETNHSSPFIPKCNCQISKKDKCPIPGQCHIDENGPVESVIYHAKITRNDNSKTEFYTGMTGGPFKERWYGHSQAIRNYDPEDNCYGKRMSVYVGDLHLNGVPTTIDWSIVCRAPTYSNVSGNCRLCLLEKYYIMYESDRATLNVKSEFFASCPHKKKLLLKNYSRREKCG